MARMGLGRPSTAEEILVASTMSTQDSGLFGYLLPIFKEKAGIDVKVLAQSTSRSLDTARRGEADVVFVHSKAAEQTFVSEGFGLKRYPVMYKDLVLIGPESDPAGVKGKDIETALQTIKVKSVSFRDMAVCCRTAPGDQTGLLAVRSRSAGMS
jgi:tungstate transport system substrate-binding protein